MCGGEVVWVFERERERERERKTEKRVGEDRGWVGGGWWVCEWWKKGCVVIRGVRCLWL